MRSSSLFCFAALLSLVSCANSFGGRSAATDAASTAVADALIRGDYTDALRRADDALAKHPGDAWPLYDRGSALAALGRTDEALEVLRDAENRFPADDLHGRSVAAYRRGLALEFAGRCGEASTEFSRYVAMVRPSAPLLAEDVLTHVNSCNASPGPQIATGGPVVDEGPARRAQAEALRAAYLNPAHQRAMAASTAAVRAMVRSDYKTALARAEDGLKDAPNDAWLLYNKGSSLAALGRTQESLDVLRRAEARFATNDVHGRSVAAYGRALVLESVGNCDQAATAYKDYSTIVGDTAGRAAAHARSHLRMCRRVQAAGRATF